MNEKWTQQEKEFVKNNSKTLTDKKLQEGLNGKYSLAAVRKMRQRLSCKKQNGRPRKVDISK